MKTTETRIMIYTSKFEESKKFYSELLGFKTRDLFEGGVMLETGSSVIELFDRPKANENNIKMSLQVENVLELWEKVKNNAHLSHILRFNSWGDTSFGILDPNGVELIFFTQAKLI